MSNTLTTHNNNFNFLRLVGSLLVLFSHTYAVLGLDNDEPISILSGKLMAASTVGLSIFFFISGYFVSRSAMTSTFFDFIKKRICRIYPALIFVVLLTVFVIGPLCSAYTAKHYFSDNNTWKYLYTISGIRMRMQLPGVFTEPAFFDHGVNASIWTISVEVMLYIFLAALLFSGLLKNKKIYRLFSFIVAATCFLTVTIYPLPGDSAKYFALAGIFFMGGFCSTVLLTQKKAFAVVIVSCLLFIPLQLFASQWIKTTCILCIIICMFCWMIGFSKKIHFRLNNDISYGLYLIAFPLQQIVFRLTGYRQSVPLHLFLTLLPAIAFAVLSWRLIEKPCIAFARKKNKSAGQLPGTFKKAE